MGIFSTKKIVKVGSSVYNLAGDEAKRQQYLNTIVGGAVFQGRNIASTIVNSYMNGPGIKLRNFINWAETSGYDDKIGLVTSTFITNGSVDGETVKPFLPKDNDDQEPILQSCRVEYGDISFWAEQKILQNRPDQFQTDWSADFDEPNKKVTITYVDGSVNSFYVDDFDSQARYIYTSYSLLERNVIGQVSQGNEITINDTNSYPSTDGYEKYNYTEEPIDVTLTKKVVTSVSYSDGSSEPDQTNTSVIHTSEILVTDSYIKTEYRGSVDVGSGISNQNYNDIRNLLKIPYALDKDVVTTTSTETLDNGLVKTTTVKTYDQSLEVKYAYRDDVRINTVSYNSNLRLFIYKYKSGNAALDALFSTQESSGEYYPFIPFRIWSKFVSEKHYSDLYPICKKAFKKAVKGDFDDVVEKIAANKDVNKIDFTYAVFGVSINVEENACKKYVFKFLSSLNISGDTGETDFIKWQQEMDKYNQSQIAYANWVGDQYDPTAPLYKTEQPVTFPAPATPYRSVRISSQNRSDINFDMSISWVTLDIVNGTGLAKSDAKVGDFWYEIGGSETISQAVPNNDHIDWEPIKVNTVTLYWQYSKTEWRSIVVKGLVHNNYVYGGKSVTIDAVDGLNDSAESGFIIPLNRDIAKSMSIKDMTQMSTACCFLVFNNYVVQKIHWYQTGLFKILLFVVIIIVMVVINVVTFGTTVPADAFIVGAAASLLASIGITGIIATIAATVISSLAVAVIASVIMKIATLAFGAKIGAIVGAVLSVVAIAAGGGALGSEGALQGILDAVSNPMTLIQLASTLANDISSMIINSDMVKIARASDNLNETYKNAMASLQSKIDANLTSGGFSPEYMEELILSTVPFYETSDTFFYRTLMTGSDIVDAANNYITGYVDTNLDVSNFLN